jgi:hypothetical protein
MKDTKEMLFSLSALILTEAAQELGSGEDNESTEIESSL